MYKRLLIPLDGSELAEASLAHGQAVAQQFGATLVLLRVVPFERMTVDEGSGVLRAEGGRPVTHLPEHEAGHLQEAEKYLSALANRLRHQGIAIETDVRRGDPVEEILKGANQGGIDLVIMSTHGRSGLSRLAFGSVAAEVIHKSGEPVLVVKHKH